jgi:ABC-type methionine transport system ATPase subunit
MGQRQLLCIARALIRSPRILILDEATSALDPASEEHLLRQLKGTLRGRTVIMITHRLAPLAIADRVALLIDGRIERVGPPTDVMAHARIRMAEEIRRRCCGVRLRRSRRSRDPRAAPAARRRGAHNRSAATCAAPRRAAAAADGAGSPAVGVRHDQPDLLGISGCGKSTGTAK